MIYRIEAGDLVGEYKAEDRADALEVYARDSGFESYAALVDEFGEVDAVWQVDVDKLVRAVADALGTAVFQDSYGRGVAMVNGESVMEYADLARMGGFDISDFRA